MNDSCETNEEMKAGHNTETIGFQDLQAHPLFTDVLDSLKRCGSVGEVTFLSDCSPTLSSANNYLSSVPHHNSDITSEPGSEVDEFLAKYTEMQQFNALQVEKFYELTDQFCSRYIALLKDGAQHLQTSDESSLAASGDSVKRKRTEEEEEDEEVPPPPLEQPRKKRRGNLPKRATNLLKKWLFEHLLHPYPTEEQKRTLAGQTSLSVNQISNWFINARRRILQPMLETVRQQQMNSTEA